MWTFCAVYVLCFSCFRVWSLPAGKGLTSLLSFVMINCVFVTFPYGILGQVWYLIVSIPDLCHLTILSIKKEHCNSWKNKLIVLYFLIFFYHYHRQIPFSTERGHLTLRFEEPMRLCPGELTLIAPVYITRRLSYSHGQKVVIVRNVLFIMERSIT